MTRRNSLQPKPLPPPLHPVGRDNVLMTFKGQSERRLSAWNWAPALIVVAVFLGWLLS